MVTFTCYSVDSQALFINIPGIMGGRWTFLLVLALAAVPVRPQLEYNITTTWNGEAIDHDPVQLTLTGSPDGEYLEIAIEAPFFNDPPAPPGPSGRPFFGLWNYEVVEAFFLNDDDQYVEVEVCPWGQHIVLLLNGQRVTIRHSLPLDVSTTRSENTWSGIARIPVGYLPKNVTKFNAYGIHGSGDNRTYESLYPTTENATAPDFHALEYFNIIDLSEILPDQGSAEMSEFWSDSIEGIFRYRIETTWDNQPLNHPPAEITLQGYTAGVEINITAPFFNDPAPPEGEPGQPFYGLWDYEVVEMFFLNKNAEYLEVELGPWGEHLLLMLKGARNVLKHSLPLDYIIVEKIDPIGGEPGVWKGSAMLPPDYFPPNITLMNAYAIHGTGDDREYQSLYPAPHNDPDFPVPDFHRLELFQPIDFEYQVANNSFYSDLWKEAMRSSSPSHTWVIESDEETEVVTILGPAPDAVLTTSAPVQQATRQEIAQAKEKEASFRKPTPQRVSSNEPPRRQREDEDREGLNPSSGNSPKPKPIRVTNRENNQPQRELDFHDQEQQLPQFHDKNEGQFPSHSQHQSRVPSQFQDQEQPFGTSPLQSERQPAFPIQEDTNIQFQEQPFNNQNTRQSERPSLFQEEPQFQNQEQTQFENPRQPPFQNQVQPQVQNQEQAQFQNPRQPTFQNQGQLQFQTQEQAQFHNQGEPQFQNQEETQRQPQSQNRGQTRFHNQGKPQFQNQGQPPFQNRGNFQFQNQGQPPFQNQGLVPQFQTQPHPQVQSTERPQFQGENRPPIQNPNTGTFQGQGPPRFQEQGRPPIHFQEQSQFEDPSPTQAPRFQDENPVGDLPGSETSGHVGLEETITSEVEQAVLTLAEGTPALPPPHPVCFELGLVPDPDRCYVFHECVLEEGLWQMYSWRCQRGQKFDPVNVACIRGRCTRAQTRRRRVRRP